MLSVKEVAARLACRGSIAATARSPGERQGLKSGNERGTLPVYGLLDRRGLLGLLRVAADERRSSQTEEGQEGADQRDGPKSDS